VILVSESLTLFQSKSASWLVGLWRQLEHGVDHSFADPQLSLIDKAIKAGKGHADFAYLFEVMKNGSGA
jgi:hypothetical protein